MIKKRSLELTQPLDRRQGKLHEGRGPRHRGHPGALGD